MKRQLLKLAVVFGVLALAAQAQALAISPGTQELSGNDTSQSDINAVLDAAYDPDLVLLYTQNQGGAEAGTLAGSYETAFNADLSGGTISYVAPGEIAVDSYLLVKDGNHAPGWYLFNLSTWNGTDDVVLSGFWPDGGAISHVSLYGGIDTPTDPPTDPPRLPEPGTLLLLGSGLVGLALYGRKTFKR